jgi:hypothetical protein
MIRLLLITTFCIFSAQSAVAGRIDLTPRLSAELNKILKVSETLQGSMLNKSEDQLDVSVREMVSQIERTVSLSRLAKPHERNHLLRILRSARENFELAQGSFGKERDSHLENGLNQLVNIVRIYKVDRAYGIFFCSRDKNSWVQKGKKPQNPFRGPASKVDCGMRVAD